MEKKSDQSFDCKKLFETLGVKPLINAGGTKSRFGGRPIRQLAREAIVQTWDVALDLIELNCAVGKEIAAMTGSEAGLVVNGAAGGTMLATSAIIAFVNGLSKSEVLPSTALKREFIALRSHWGQYSYLIENAGGKLVGAGYVNRATLKHIESAVGPNTCGIVFVAGPGISLVGPKLEEVVEFARPQQLPVFVSAAATLPPRSQLKAYIQAGADIVTISGGKHLGSTQTSGLLIGKKELIDRASEMLHPNHGLGRALKMSKEDIIATYISLKEYYSEDEELMLQREVGELQYYATKISQESGILAKVQHDSLRHFYPCITISFKERPDLAKWVEETLLASDPRIFIRHYEDIAMVAMERSCCTKQDFDVAVGVCIQILSKLPF